MKTSFLPAGLPIPTGKRQNKRGFKFKPDLVIAYHPHLEEEQVWCPPNASV
jgi:hypothetical protein